MAYEKLNLKKDDLLDEAVFKKIDDAIEALDGALDAKAEEVEKVRMSTNIFDKSAHPFINDWYINNSIVNGVMPVNAGIYGGSGWRDIPVEAGKTYVLCVNNPVTLTDMNNITYGVFTNLIFTDVSHNVITTCPFSASNYFAKAYVGGVLSDDALAAMAYDSKKASVRNYSSGPYRMGTNCIVVEIKDENIQLIHVQIGSTSFGQYQINTDFNTRGHLTDTEIEQVVNSFQINEGTELLPYEEYYKETYTTIEVTSNLTKLQSAFTEKAIEPTNILKPSYAMNHRYITNSIVMTTNSNGNYRISTNTYPKSAMLSIPVTVGDYVIAANALQDIGNVKFMYFGAVMYMDDLDGIVTYSYNGYTNPYFAKHTDFLPDPAKADATGFGTQTLKIHIYDESITSMYVVLFDSNKNPSGIWTAFDQTNGLTDEQLYSLVYNAQMNKGKVAKKWEPFDADMGTQAYVKTEYIEGLDTFKEEINAMMENLSSTAKSSGTNMVCNIEDDYIYIRAKQWTDNNDFVWKCEKTGGNNKYFNIVSANTCSSIEDDEVVPAITSWKGASDDIFPPNFNGTYVGANHGYYGVSVVTVTGHDKTEADIGSIWLSGSTTFCLIKIIDENTLWLMPYNDSCMSSGYMITTLASGTLIHSSGATNTSDIVVESSTRTQLWRCANKYSIKLLIDGIEQNIEENTFYCGDRVEILTQYNIIFVPAMLTYLMNNVGNNTNDSQYSDDIEEFYMTLYINYQFNMNGSVSTYSSYYVGKDITRCQLGLVQSMAISNPAYNYIPDTQYDVITVHETSNTSSFNFTPSTWNSTNKAPYRYYQFTSDTCAKGICLAYDRSIGYGNNEKRVPMIAGEAGFFNGSSKKMYPQLIHGQDLSAGTLIDGMAARVPLYKYDPDVTSVGWYWCSNDIILMIDTHNTVNKDIVLPDYMNNMRIEKLDITDSVKCEQSYIFNNKLRFVCTSDYGYAVLRLYK